MHGNMFFIQIYWTSIGKKKFKRIFTQFTREKSYKNEKIAKKCEKGAFFVRLEQKESSLGKTIARTSYFYKKIRFGTPGEEIGENRCTLMCNHKVKFFFKSGWRIKQWFLVSVFHLQWLQQKGYSALAIAIFI